MAKVIDAAGANHFPCSTLVAAQDAQETAASATPEGLQEHDILKMTLANIMLRTWNSDECRCDAPAELSMDVVRLIAVTLERALFEDALVGPGTDFGLHLVETDFTQKKPVLTAKVFRSEVRFGSAGRVTIMMHAGSAPHLHRRRHHLLL